MRFFFCLAAALAAISLSSLLAAADFSLGLDAPFTEHSTTRERQCLNGLWRFRPLSPDEKLSNAPPQPEPAGATSRFPASGRRAAAGPIHSSRCCRRR